MEELRLKRTELQTVEVSLSYQRRVAQGHLDIVGAERRRRSGYEEALDSDRLVETLSAILSDRSPTPGLGRLSLLMAPEPAEIDTSEVDAILASSPGERSSLTEAELSSLVERLSAYESDISSQRRQLHQGIDALQAEMTHRYRTGEASVDSLLS